MKKISTIYTSRTGMLEPLGQSQVLAYLRGLSSDYAVTLISFEREADVTDSKLLTQIERVCADHGIRWIQLRYRRKPRLLGSAWNLCALVYNTWRETKRGSARLIHARSYVPAAAAWAVGRMTGIPYIFDMRSLWPEELITSRRLQRGSLLHRIIFWAEGRLVRDAATVVSLTRAGADYLHTAHPGSLSPERLAIIPTCTDVDRFRPSDRLKDGPPVIGCHGSLTNGWFRIDLLAAMFSRMAARLPDARFEIITREDASTVLAALNETGRLSPEVSRSLSISAALPTEIHARLQAQDLSMFFYASGATSELGRSPTRMGEALSCGVPVVTNTGIGDAADVVSTNGVGLVLEGEDDAMLDRAADAAVTMIRNSEISERCRATAESIYSLPAGVEAYNEIYAQIQRRDTAHAANP